MNRPITRLYGLVILLFALLVAFTSRWTVFEAASLRNNSLNHRPLLADQRIRRGSLLAADGTVLARSTPNANGVYRRTYPLGGLFAHAIGYSYANLGRTALEQSRNPELTGRTTTQINSLLDQFTGKTRTGNDVITTLDPKAQRAALRALGGQKGAVVALDPRNGAIRVFAAVPGYDPGQVPTDFKRLTTGSNSPLFDRVTQSGYPPGSTFKVVTAIAAIDSGRFTPSSPINGDSPKAISGVPLKNDFNQSFGTIDLTTALTKSVNTVWAQVAVALGKQTLGRYMSRLGFNVQPPIDLPPSERRASGEYKGRHLLDPTSGAVDVGRMGIGQDKLGVTPLQMAMVAAAVANHGRLMTPHLTDRVVDRDGRTTTQVAPQQFSQVMKGSTADAVAAMMGQVVKEGTGTAAALQGIAVAGKTGTAEIVPGQSINQVWFIAFAPTAHPTIAIAATVERSSGQGGTVAAPIAKQVLQSLLGGG
ncbi:MAG: penicillin-binding transpeptidase domain-containing protein [Solirubrobacteraceae bacterium]